MSTTGGAAPYSGAGSLAGPRHEQEQSSHCKSVQNNLQSDGVVAFNLNAHADTAEDTRTIESAFPQAVVFACPGSSNVVAIAAMARIPDDPSLEVRAQELDRRFGANFPFQQILNDRQPYAPRPLGATGPMEPKHGRP